MRRSPTSSVLLGFLGFLGVLGPLLFALGPGGGAVATTAEQGARGAVAPDLAVSGKAAKASGAQLKYDVTLTASGTTSHDATVVLDPPAGLRVDLSRTGAGTCSGTDPVTCVVPPFAGAGAVRITLRFTPGNPGPLRLDVTLSADPADDAEAWNNVAKVIAARRQICDNRPTANSDRIDGTAKGDILCGLDGHDQFWGGEGDDIMFGGSGRDSVSYRGAPNTSIDLRKQGIGSVGAAPTGYGVDGHGRDFFTGIENAFGGEHHDTMLSNAKRNLLYGDDGNDLLMGLAGKDVLLGAHGKDDLVGGEGEDSLDGGPGTDTCEDDSDLQVSCEH